MNTDVNAQASARPMESIRFDNLLINFTTEFHRIWDTRGSKAKPATFWRPTPVPDALPGFFSLGDVVVSGYDNISGNRTVAVVCEADSPSADATKGKALSRPVGYELVWKDSGTNARSDGSIWRPIPPDGYVALGLVSVNDHTQPSLNAVRCVREDLVMVSFTHALIWNDEGSGASQDFSAWSVIPPAAGYGEIYLASGSFAGANSYSRPTVSTPVYSLRMPVAVEINSLPAVPVLNAVEPNVTPEPAQATQIARLPWFTIKDPELSPLEQLRTSPFYLMQRTDRYVLVGQGHNKEDTSKTFRWTAPRAQREDRLKAFTDVTSVEMQGQWQSAPANPSILFSARLDQDFARSEPSSIEWSNPAPLDVISLVESNTAVAVYLVQSDYRLLRENGTDVTSGFSYTDSVSLHISKYSARQEEVIASPVPATDPSNATGSAP